MSLEHLGGGRLGSAERAVRTAPGRGRRGEGRGLAALAGTSLRVTLPLRSDARVQTPSTNKQTKPGFSVTYRSLGESVI